MITYGFLELDEQIRSTDEVRDTTYHYGYGDVPFNLDHVAKWERAKTRIPAWVGKTLRQYATFDQGRIENIDIEVRRKL